MIKAVPLSIGVLLVTAGYLLMVQLIPTSCFGESDVIRTKRLELINSRGETVGSMGTDVDGTPFMELSRDGSLDAGGRIRIDVPSVGGPRCALIDNRGRVRGSFSISVWAERKEGDPKTFVPSGQVARLLLLGEDEKISGDLGPQLDGELALVVRRRDGTRARFPEAAK